MAAASLAGLMACLAAVAGAQSASPGSVSGKLTDLFSRPVAGATVVLRNALTGVEVTTTSAKNGQYRFNGLVPGEYTLQAGSPQLGEGRIESILVSSGHEAHVQAAVEFARRRVEASAAPRSLADTARPADKPLPPSAKPQAPIFRQTFADPPVTASVAFQTALSSEPIERLPLSPSLQPLPAKVVPDSPRSAGEPQLPPAKSPGLILPRPSADPPATASVTLEAALPPQSIENLALTPVLRPLPAAAQIAQALPHSLPVDVESPGALPALSEHELQALPLSGRHWENFVLDSPPARTQIEEDDGQPSNAKAANPIVTVDGANAQMAFGGRAGGRMRTSSLMGPAAAETAIGEVRNEGKSSEPTGEPFGDRASVTTHTGTSSLHGQGFVFDRRNLWGAQNPFTQWVKETAPATLDTTPTFMPFPYTAPDREDRWGFGVGSEFKRRKLFWFAAIDGSVRNDPGVATVRHPDNFFSQPANDEMQVLSARLGLSAVNPVSEGLAAYSGMLESLAGLLGPAPRTADQWVGFGRIDWQAAERHRFTLEGTAARWNSPGGGLTRASELYGTHSFGSSRASEIWLLGRWEAFLTPNLLAVLQGSVGRHILAEDPAEPSPFEQNFNANAWGHLPQMVIDSRYGFTIGNPAWFGSGSYPDEHLYELQPTVDWIRGNFLLKAGADWRHNADATSMIRNHLGTYHYSTIENFVSDALVFAKYGLSDALDRFDQHNCDQRGRAWRDTGNQLHGLGYLPCYSYYSQTMGPTEWHLSTNDLAGYVTSQWQPAKRFVMSAAFRWQREYFPPPIALVNNPALPLTQRIPSPGNEWAPRVSLAWGSGESRLPVLRAGYGLYFGRTQNSVLESALIQTGSFQGDLNFFFRPTDNLAGGGAPPFPYVLAGEPSTVVKPAAVEIAPGFRNPEIHQAEASLEEKLPGKVQIVGSAIMSLGRRLPVTLDTNFDPASNPGTITYRVVNALNAGPLKAGQITVPFFASWPGSGSGRLNPGYQQIAQLISRANSTYEAAMLRVSRTSRRGVSFHARYTYAHAMDWNPNESMSISAASVLDPTDFRQEYGTSNLDIRHSLSSMLIWEPAWKRKALAGQFANGWTLSAIGQFHSGLPYTMRTAGSIPEEFLSSGTAIVGLGPGMNGYGGDNRVYGVGRNTYRYPYTWKADTRLGKKFELGQMREIELLAESFNLFNHQNVTRLETVGYSISPGSVAGSLPTLNFLTGLKTGQTEFGKPLDVNATDFYRPRQFDFGLRVRF